MQTVPPDDLTILDIPGRAAEIAYTDPAPSSWLPTLIAYLLHLVGAAIGLGLASITWQLAAELEKQIHIPESDYYTILATGWIIALAAALVLIAIGQMMILAIHTEHNTRQQKELIFYWLRKEHPPRR